METEISRTVRHLAPVHYSMKVNSYSSVSEIKKYKSGVFEAGGYHWKLIFYPNGDTKNCGANHISLYLKIVMTEALPAGWELYVKFQVSVHNQLEDNYLVVQDNTNGGVKRFNATKKSWGFAKLLPIKTFEDSSKGYIVRDSCLFGAEVFVLKNSGKWESVTLVEAINISNTLFTWEIKKFSEPEKPYTESAVFSVGERNWKLRIYPRGENIYEGKYLSLYLMPSNWKTQIQKKAGVYAEYILRVVDKVNGKHKETKCSKCFQTSDSDGMRFGFAAFVSLDDLNELSKGLTMKGSLTVEVQFLCITDTKYSDDVIEN